MKLMFLSNIVKKKILKKIFIRNYSNICGGLKKPSDVCLVDGQAFQYSKDNNLCYPISKPNTPTVTLLNPADEKAGVKVVHQPVSMDRTSRQLSLEISCDVNGPAAPSFKYMKEQINGGIIVYSFSGSTKSICPGVKPDPNNPTNDSDLPLGQYGIGGLIMTLALVALILYFIIGFAILKFKMQKTGTEVIPQFTFWKDLPFLFIDGIMLPVDLIKGCMGKKNYQEMA